MFAEGGIMRLRLALLGSFQVLRDNMPITAFATDLARGLLAYLAVESDRPHRREALAGLLWPDRPDAVALQNLRQTLARLRRALGDETAAPPFLLITPSSIQFNAETADLDVAAFQDLLAAAEAHRHDSLETCPHCLWRLRQAAALYRGEFLQGFLLQASELFEEWARLKREELHIRALAALDTLAAYHERRREYGEASEYARRQIALEPWRESAHRQLMRALAVDGRERALAQYEACRQALAEHLGVEPSAETIALYERIRSGRLRPETLAAQAVTRPALRNFPVRFTPFVGRQAELARITEHLLSPDCRLLTLTGPGGIGKTRLAAQAAGQLAAEKLLFDDGIYFVPLAAVAEAAALVPTLAAGLGLSFYDRTPPQVQLLNYLRGKNLLLLLDNFEHLLDGAELLLDILRQAPGVKLLVTSREPLNLEAEWLLAVEGLPYPSEEALKRQADDSAALLEYAAVKLFVLQASRARSDFALAPEQYPRMAQLCHLLWGVPLAIELAAVWIRQCSLEQIVKQIAATLDFLVTPLRDVPARHRSLRAVFEGSWELLTSAEQLTLAQISVFNGGFSHEAGEAICREQGTGDRGQNSIETSAVVLSSVPYPLSPILTSLVDKSLVRRLATDRFEIHELVRQFAAEKLGDVASWRHDAPNNIDGLVRARHSAYYVSLVADREPALDRQVSPQLLGEVRAEIDNIRQAWRWAAAEANLELLGRGCQGLAHLFRLLSLNQEGSAFLELAAETLRAQVESGAEASEESRRVLAQLLAGQAGFLNLLGQYDRVVELSQTALQLAAATGDQHSAIQAHLAWGQALWYKGEHSEAERQTQRALGLAQQVRLTGLEADALRNLGVIAELQGAYAAARSYYERTLQIYDTIGDRRSAGIVVNNLGSVARMEGNYAEARAYFAQALGLKQAIGDQRSASITRMNLAMLADEQYDFGVARSHYEQALQLFREIGERGREASTLHNLGNTLRDQGDYAAAGACYDSALELERDLGRRMAESSLLSDLGLLWHYLGDQEVACDLCRQALRISDEIGGSPDQDYTLTNLGHALVELGHLAEAANAYQQALQLRRAAARPDLATETLAGLARIALIERKLDQAQSYVEEILPYLERGALDGTDEPQRIYLTCYQVLHAQRDARGDAILEAAHRSLLARAAAIDDPAMRRSLLETVATHRDVVAAWSQREAG
jgi:predicted ATPase/DNA-binding SARP family transcriptional activator/Tfp pilus assembly protein PilF